MDYPIQIELDITQDDFIQVEILEQELDMLLAKKSYLNFFILQTAVISVLALAVFLLRNVIMWQSVFFLLAFWLIFAFHFLYNYFFGAKREFNMGVSHILQNSDNHSFFKPEKGMAFFYEDRCEYLTNEQRRYFSYDKINNIKITPHLFIFVMKKVKNKDMKGFAYMVIPKRNADRADLENLEKICREIQQRYCLKPWVESEIFG